MDTTTNSVCFHHSLAVNHVHSPEVESVDYVMVHTMLRDSIPLAVLRMMISATSCLLWIVGIMQFVLLMEVLDTLLRCGLVGYESLKKEDCSKINVGMGMCSLEY
mmetsp:Transcript_10201/g.17512  ORF Transcript_10201/g.17512 Transcript_10201/m.17512 type:complete len:105 (+) Transcript_10201:1339-1653(+)